MTINRKLSILLAIVISTSCFAQNADIKRTYHWYFGNNCGIDFTSGIATAVTNGALNTLEGCAAISDTSGTLQFYTDGINVWDSTHKQMPNGYDLHGEWSSLNSAVIVPKPNSNNLYYIFTTPAQAGHFSGHSAFEYSIVDMNLNDGLGDVTVKNISLFPIATEQLGVVYHKNKKDYWVVAHEAFTNNFMGYLVTDSGISLTPVISSVGFKNGGYTPECWGCATANLKFSISGCRLACTYPLKDTLEIFDFDNSTGKISNPVTLNISYPWGVCFSPNNNLLYLASYDLKTSQRKMDQFDLTKKTQNEVMASRTLLSNVSVMGATMQNASDGKIYCTKDGYDYLAVIDAPNQPGTSCNFVSNGFYLGGKLSASGITNFVQSYFVNDTLEYYCPTISTAISEQENTNSFDVYPNPFTFETTLKLNQNLQNARLALYNKFGQEVKVMHNISGTEIILLRENLPSGIYFIVLTRDNQKNITHRLIITDK